MDKRNGKFYRCGFSLFEVCVTMGIVVIFIAACTNVFTSRHKALIENYTHGRFECYYDINGKLHEGLYNGNTKEYDKQVESDKGYCTFTPPKNLKSVVVNAIAAGGNGNESAGGTAGDFTSFYLSNLTKTLYLKPGHVTVGEEDKSLRDTYIYDKIDDGKFKNDTAITTLRGGVDADDIAFLNCTIGSYKYNCGIEPTCTIDNRGSSVTVKFCVGNVTNESGSSEGEEENNSKFDQTLYKSVTIKYDDKDVETRDMQTYYRENDRCDNDSTQNRDKLLEENKQIPKICKNDNTCTKKLIISYSYDKTFCNDSGIYDENTKTNNITENYFNLVLKKWGNITEKRQTSKMTGITNSLGLISDYKDGSYEEGIKGIGARKYYKTKNDTKEVYYNISTGEGGQKDSDPINTVGGHGSVLIVW